jgi:hypothetical protein
MTFCGLGPAKNFLIDFGVHPVHAVSFLKSSNIVLIIYTRDFKLVLFRVSARMHQSSGSVGLGDYCFQT